MYSPSPGRRAASIESEVFYWRLLGFQVVLIYGFILVALITGLLSIHDENFDRTMLTVVAIFCSNLLYMPQTKQPSFDSCTEKKVKLSNAAYRFSRQWSIRRQDKRRRACSQLHINIIRAGCRALVAFLYSAVAKSESWTYGRGRTEIWNIQRCSFFSNFRFRLHTGRGPRFRSRICLGISSPALPGCTPGDVALRGIYTLTGQAAVRWYVVIFYRVPAVSSFIAQLAIYCFIGGVFDTAQLICRFGLLIERELAVVVTAIRRTNIFWQCLLFFPCVRSPAPTCAAPMVDVAWPMRGAFTLIGDAAVRLYFVLFQRAPAVFGFLAELALYCFLGAVADALQIAGRCGSVVQCFIGVAAAIATRRTRIYRSRHGSQGKLHCRGSGFRNLFLSIFVLFLLGGFLLEGNPPGKGGGGLAAPPFHAGGGDQPVGDGVRYSERLAQQKSGLGSTFLRLTQPDASSSYVPRWPFHRNSESSVGNVPEVSIADPNSPPRSPEAEAVEAEVLDGACDVLHLMRSLDSTGELQSGLIEREGSPEALQPTEPTWSVANTEMHLEFSAPNSDLEVERCGDTKSANLSRAGGGCGTSDVVVVDNGAESQNSPEPRSRPQGSARKSSVKAKAKSGAKYQWVPKVADAPAEAQSKAEAWATLDSIDLAEEWKHSCATVREVPEFFRRQVQEAFHVATSRIRTMHGKDKEKELERAWKLFLLLPRMLLSRTKSKGDHGKKEFFARFRSFQRGDWLTLVQNARVKRKQKTQRVDGTVESAVEARLRAAEQRARWGELSHARQELVGTPLAPRSMDTYSKLCERPTQPRSFERLQQVCAFKPESAVQLDYCQFISNVRSSPRGKSGGLSGMRNEHLKCLVFSPRQDDCDALYYVAETLARAEIPAGIRKGIALARMTALDKGSAKVRGIAAGDTFRRVVAKTLAQQFSEEFDDACAPYQFALSTRAGTDCVGHALREITHQHPGNVVTSLDGIGAYDHVDRAQMLEALVALPKARSLLPFVAMFYGHTSEYYWTHETGEVWSVEQGDGGEQGDPLMPALFALGQHPALASADEKLQEICFVHRTEEEYFKPLLFAFLDDLYVVTTREMARRAFDVVTGEVERIAGIRTNLGKLQLYSQAGGPCPPGFDDFLAERAVDAKPIWTCDAPQIEHRGIVVLGSPLGTVEFCKAHAEARMAVEQVLLDWIPKVPTLQIGWLLLYFCAATRANHLIRLLPPSLSTEYAERHDRAILQCLESLLQAGPLPEKAKRIAILRCVNGGLGLRSAKQTAPAAYWAAWADALPMLHARLPEQAYAWSEALEFAQANVAHVEFLRRLPLGLQEAELARRQLVAEGYRTCPTWEDIRAGVLPKNPAPLERAPGEWCRGWQFYASRVRDAHFLDFEVRPHSSPTERALLLSQGGPFAAQFLKALPTKPQLELENVILQCLFRRRLRLPLVDGLCNCPASSHGSGKNKFTTAVALDEFGDHLASCMRTGRVQRRANVLEKIWMQIFEEAGGTLVPNEKLRNMRIGVDVEDKRRVEFAVYNMKFGPPLLCDATQVSPLDQNGDPHPKCAVTAGAAFEVAEKRKTNTYREAAQAAGRIVLETLACEIGGRWSDTCIKRVGMLAKYKARNEPPHLKRAVEFAWHSRWWSLLSVAAQRAFALSLIEVDCDAIKPLADFEPRVGDILADVRYELGPVFSRLPLRG